MNIFEAKEAPPAQLKAASAVLFSLLKANQVKRGAEIPDYKQSPGVTPDYVYDGMKAPYTVDRTAKAGLLGGLVMGSPAIKDIQRPLDEAARLGPKSWKSELKQPAAVGRASALAGSLAGDLIPGAQPVRALTNIIRAYRETRP